MNEGLNITYSSYTSSETKKQLVERLIKENKINIDEALKLLQEEYTYPTYPTYPDPCIYPQNYPIWQTINTCLFHSGKL